VSKKKAGQAKAGPTKVSVVLPQNLVAMIDQACNRHDLSVSTLIRKLISAGITAWLEPQSTSAGALQQQGATATIQVTQALAQALDAVCRYTGLTRDAVAQLVLAENLGEFGERARKRHEELLRLPAPPTRGGDEPEPA